MFVDEWAWLILAKYLSGGQFYNSSKNILGFNFRTRIKGRLILNFAQNLCLIEPQEKHPGNVFEENRFRM